MSHLPLSYEKERELTDKAAQLRGEMGVKLPDAIIAMTYHQIDADIFISNDYELKKKLSFEVLTPDMFVDRYLPSLS